MVRNGWYGPYWMKKWISGEEECRPGNEGITDTWSCAFNRTRMFWLERTDWISTDEEPECVQHKPAALI